MSHAHQVQDGAFTFFTLAKKRGKHNPNPDPETENAHE